jgi:outer membrane protein assembly factor BamB
MTMRLRALIVTVSICLPLGAVASAEDWPEFRGPTGQGLSTAARVPVRWSSTENVAWKRAIPGVGWSSPVLVAGRIYLTTAGKASITGDTALSVVCLDAADGRIVWEKEVLRPAASEARAMHQKNSLASPTAIVAGQALYVHFGHMGTAALDLAGNVLWRQTDIKYSPEHGNGGSPALAGDRLVFSCDGSRAPCIVALDRATGDVRWNTPRSGGARQTFSFSTPLVTNVDGVDQVISPTSGYVGAYDPGDGREIWRVKYGEGFSVVPRPVFAHGLVFVCTGWQRARLLAIDPRGAQGDVTESHVRWSHDRGVPFTPSPLVAGDEIYFVADNGVATCLDARTGRQHWSERLGGNFSASPVYADGHVYFLSEEGVTSVVRAGTSYELVATNELGEQALASPAVAEGAIFLRTRDHLWRVGE